MSSPDDREGTAAAHELERLDRVRDREERQQATARRDQAAVEREEAESERDAQYRAAAPKRQG